MLRHSPLFHFNHGNHVCVFYRTADALREVLIPYLAEGLRRGERCFCAQNPDLCKQIIYDLRFLGIDTDGAIRRGALEVHTVDEVYFPNNKFEAREDDRVAVALHGRGLEIRIHRSSHRWRTVMGRGPSRRVRPVVIV